MTDLFQLSCTRSVYCADDVLEKLEGHTQLFNFLFSFSTKNVFDYPECVLPSCPPPPPLPLPVLPNGIRNENMETENEKEGNGED